MAGSVNGVYYSNPKKYIFEITSSDESNGWMEGRFEEEGKGQQDIASPRFHFAGGHTDLSFSTKGFTWKLQSESYGSNAATCEELKGMKFSSAYTAAGESVHFYKDLSGQGGSWFGNTDWWGTSGI